MRFLLLDSIEQLLAGERVVARRRFSARDEIFRDHFPGLPLVPGTLLIECVAQAAGFLVFESLQRRAFPLLVMVERAKFRLPAAPEQDLRIEAHIDSRSGSLFRVTGAVRRDGVRLADVRLVLRVLRDGEQAMAGELAQESVSGLLRWAAESYERLCGARRLVAE